ncbi:hypothetical protein IWQ60_003551 [Tieghemiomyces parasiticus]|uniref:MICOS complex subunit n=1 Tax=Tieghemiomyces parasiticus TaxID=78921 RepID=A0A9W8AD29_9FUNG|nr:hypothetical protein IWQ60_003551 [Tieghemiomyces parasiticus]
MQPSDIEKIPDPKSLSIYEEKKPMPQEPTGPSRLQLTVRDFRVRATQFLQTGQVWTPWRSAHLQMTADRVVDLEQQAETAVQKTVPKNEQLFPGALYIAVAGLAGSVFTRNRNFLIRWTSPFLFAGASAFYFLPGTARVVTRRLYDEYGDPATEQQARETLNSFQGLGAKISDQVGSSVRDARQTLVDTVRSVEPKNDPKK